MSTEEGSAFRDLMEFGVLAEQVREAEGPGLERIAAASGLELKEVEGKLERYRSMAEKLSVPQQTTE